MTMPSISFILPWYRRLELFRFALPFNEDIFSDNAEVVLAIDDPQDSEGVMALVREYSRIRFVVIVNPAAHEWRPPCRAINVGIRHASGTRIVIISPETILKLPDAGYLSRHHLSDPGLVTGILWGIDWNESDADAVSRSLHNYRTTPPTNFGYGFLLCAKSSLEAVRGFDESRQGYGRDDCDIRFRMMNMGMPMLVDPQIHMLHPAHPCPVRGSTEYQLPRVESVLLDQPDWGRDFAEVVYDWKIAGANP